MHRLFSHPHIRKLKCQATRDFPQSPLPTSSTYDSQKYLKLSHRIKSKLYECISMNQLDETNTLLIAISSRSLEFIITHHFFDRNSSRRITAKNSCCCWGRNSSWRRSLPQSSRSRPCRHPSESSGSHHTTNWRQKNRKCLGRYCGGLGPSPCQGYQDEFVEAFLMLSPWSLLFSWGIIICFWP